MFFGRPAAIVAATFLVLVPDGRALLGEPPRPSVGGVAATVSPPDVTLHARARDPLPGAAPALDVVGLISDPAAPVIMLGQIVRRRAAGAIDLDGSDSAPLLLDALHDHPPGNGRGVREPLPLGPGLLKGGDRFSFERPRPGPVATANDPALIADAVIESERSFLASVPVPASAGLLAIVLAGLVGLKARRRSARQA